MKFNLRKKVVDDNPVNLYQNMDGLWLIEDENSEDCVSYNTEKEALEDFDKIQDLESLTEIMGWELYKDDPMIAKISKEWDRDFPEKFDKLMKGKL